MCNKVYNGHAQQKLVTPCMLAVVRHLHPPNPQPSSSIKTSTLMQLKYFLLPLLLLISTSNLPAQTREVIELDAWKFLKGDPASASHINFDDTHWQPVIIPHDWAIYGPFDKEIDKQMVKIEQNNEAQATEKTGRTGALPFIGVGWYRKTIDLPALPPKNRSC